MRTSVCSRPSSVVANICGIVAVSLLLCLEGVDGHGFLQTPRSRNWYAFEDGVSSGDATKPMKEFCYHCLNKGGLEAGICGITPGGADYTFPKSSTGSDLAWTTQASYVEGATITIESGITTHKGGHFELYLCTNVDNPSKECFMENPLTFVQDNLYGAPIDVNHPERGYVAPSSESQGTPDNGHGMLFSMEFALPEGVSGTNVLLLWKYMTGNACRYEGYDEYPWPEGWEPNSALGPCEPIPDVSGTPEQFWNCAELEVIPSEDPVPVAAPTSMPVTSPVDESGCCSMDFKYCHPWGQCGDAGECCFGTVWMNQGEDPAPCVPRLQACEIGSSTAEPCCGGSQVTCVKEEENDFASCVFTGNPAAPSSESPTSVPSSHPTANPSDVPTKAPVDAGSSLFETDNTASSYSALLYLESITYEVDDDPDAPVDALIASGGAAGSGDVVSEGQAYAVLATGITLAAMDADDPNRDAVKDQFHAYFNGWKQMCEQSSAPCQATKFCNGGTVACLPGWKHNADFTQEVGSGSAPDADEDAIVGMILAVKAVENDAVKPSWYDTVQEWADASATQFLYSSTEESDNGTDRRIVKLGSCWGGWEHNGNNPSYHSPGSYRIMRDYQVNYSGRSYSLPNFGDGLSLEVRWNNLIETSYDVLAAVQCPDVGMVPNWARVAENGSEIESDPGSFSGSGTPQYEFGSEGGRTIWRVAFDYAAFPEDAAARAGAFLAPLQSTLADGFDETTFPYWEDQDLSSCQQPVVDQTITVFSNWVWNAFIYSPVYSSLVAPIDGVSASEQQAMIDKAGYMMNYNVDSQSYYPRCWSVLGMMLVNGDVHKAAQVLQYT